MAGPNINTGLVDSNGYFWSTVPEVEKNASKDSVEKELRLQIELVLKSGINISHMDCHMATALEPKFQDIYLKLSKEYKIPGIFPRDYSAFNLSAQANEIKNKGLNKTVDVNPDGSFSFLCDVFEGKSGESESSRLNLPLLGKINIDAKLSQSCDRGIPFVKEYPGSRVQEEFKKISHKIMKV